jgi:transposase-like protein
MGEEGYAMEKSTTPAAEAVGFKFDVRELIRQRVRDAIEVVLQEELSVVLGSEPYERNTTRRGYRNGIEERQITTEAGTRAVHVPRARIEDVDGNTKEFRSQILPRYARRARYVDEAILGAYLAGANSRRIRRAFEPLLGTEHLSKSSISRVVGRLKDLFAAWQLRDLSTESYPILFLDGFHLKVRMARRVVSVPVLAVLGVGEDGTKVLLGLGLAMSEATSQWTAIIHGLQKRGLTAPRLLIVDGGVGLNKALAAWPGAKVQRCTVHKLANLLEHCPVHARNEVRRDYRRIIQAKDGVAARTAYDAFLAKWKALCPAVARSLEEAGTDLLTFYEFPRAMWRALRTTNAVENLNREFRRRTKTQGSFGTEDAALTLLYGLVAFGQIRLHKIDGYRQLPALLRAAATQVA